MFKYGVYIVVSLFCNSLYSQSIHGKIVEEGTKNELPFAKVQLVDFNTTVLADENGEFTIVGKFPEKLVFRVSLLGFETFSGVINATENIEIHLKSIHFDMEEVKVTASKNELRRNSVNYVELKSMRELNELPKTSMGQMIEGIPGVYNLSTGPGISKPVIRGLQGTRVLTFLNGTRVEGQQWGGDHGMGVSELGIGVVEVLKGPASLQYGSDALGGVLYLSNEDFEKQGFNSITVSSQFESNTLGTTNSLLYNGNLKNIKIIAGGRFASHADYQIPTGKFVDNTRFQNSNAKVALNWHKNKWISNLNYDYSRAFIGIPGDGHDSIPTKDDFLSNSQLRKKELPFQYSVSHISSWENKFVFEKHTLQVLTAFTLDQLMEFEEEEEEPEMSISTYNLPYKINIDSRLKNNFVLTYGLQGMYLFQKNDPAAEELLLPNVNQLESGLYFLTTWSKNKWKLQGGVRGDLRSVTSFTEEKFTHSFSKNYSGFNFSFGANHNFSSHHILRMNVASGHRIPHISELLSDGVHHGAFQYEVGDSNLKTEKALQLDVSYEYSGEHLSLVINPFINGIQDYIYLQPQDSIIDDIQVFRYKQAQKEVLQTGADIGLHYHPHFAHLLHIESSLSYLTVIAQNSNEYSLIPQPRWSNSFIIRPEMKSKFRVDNIILSHHYYFPQNQVSQFEIPSVDYSTFDLGLQFTYPSETFPVNLQIGVRNITNTSYINHLSRLKRLEIQNPGRSFYVKLSMNIISQKKK